MKKTKLFWILPVVGIIFLASACASPAEVENEETNPENNQEQQELENNQEQEEIIGQNLEFETLFLTFDSRHEEEMFYIIGDEESFTDLWVDKLGEEMYEVDFDENMVLAVFTGEKPSGGYQVEIIEVIETEDTIEVIVDETSPAEDDMVTMALTYPGHIIMLENSEKEVVFNMHK